MAANQDIFEARENMDQHNYSYVVYAGSPLVKANWGNGYNVSHQGDCLTDSLPVVTGLIERVGLSGIYGALSGSYDNRFDDGLFYTVGTGMR